MNKKHAQNIVDEICSIAGLRVEMEFADRDEGVSQEERDDLMNAWNAARERLFNLLALDGQGKDKLSHERITRPH